MLNLIRLFLAVGGVALGIVAYRVQVEDIASPGNRALATVAVGWAFLLAGLVAWSRRPANRLGALMLVTAFALLLRQLRYSDDPLVFTTFFALGDVAYALVGHCVLAYPTGRVTDRAERALVKAGYATVLTFPLTALFFYDGTRPLLTYPTPRESVLAVSGNPDVVEGLQNAMVIVLYGILATLFIALIVRRLVRATPRARRVLAPLLLAGIAVALRAVFEGVFTFVDRPFAYYTLFWWQIAAIAALPLALMAGLLRARLARAEVGSLVLELERTPPQGLRDALARALGDPTLAVAFWLPERRAFVDAAGRPVELPPDDRRRAVTRLEDDGEPVAALVHDPTLREEPELVEAAGAAARLALQNARLQAELQAQLIAVRESRGRIVAATDAERQRIERDLHDGAQQRLLALALALRSAERRHEGTLDPELEHVLDTAVAELQGAVDDLRELTHGLHPTLLAEQGLEAALRALTARMPLAIELDVNVPQRPPPAVEAAAYFVVSEALTNVVKHAAARTVTVTAAQRDGSLRVEVTDDGVGGADPAGSGLRGLADRIDAVGGRLAVDSRPGEGTRVAADIPLGSP
ncbi:MAG: sensor histidine kinase [Thermoleophilia bacterium]|nr:sensor histidine kinase [Thermoleophilia bacterium]